MASGSSATITIVVTAPDDPGTITNNVEVSANEADPDDSNNSASVDTTVLSAGYNIYLPIIMRY